MGLPAIKGAILEELVLHLLTLVGYRTIVAGDDGTHKGKSGLEVEGRGERHQIDALAAFDHSPPFMYPIRLLMEAKCQKSTEPVGIDIVRNSVGVLKDISENYFTVKTGGAESSDGLKVQRFNYQSAIFSTSGYTSVAERYAIAHQIFLVQYENIPVFMMIKEGLENMTMEYFGAEEPRKGGLTKRARMYVRTRLKGEPAQENSPFSEQGNLHLQNNIINPLQRIRGSYFGMLQGKWPMHLLSSSPLPSSLFDNTDTVLCRVSGRGSENWSFSPIGAIEGSKDWFKLEFDLPEEIAMLVKAAQGDKVEIADLKKQYFSFISLSGRIGGIQRQVRLELDEDWIGAYLDSVKKRKSHISPKTTENP